MEGALYVDKLQALRTILAALMTDQPKTMCLHSSTMAKLASTLAVMTHESRRPAAGCPVCPALKIRCYPELWLHA